MRRTALFAGILMVLLPALSAPQSAQAAGLELGDRVTAQIESYNWLQAQFVDKKVTCAVIGIDGDRVALKRTGLFSIFSHPFSDLSSCVTKIGAKDSNEMTPATASLLKEKPKAPNALAEAQVAVPSHSDVSKEAN
jgi:hypothetical protein